MHGLPLNQVSMENLLKIGSIVGRALDTDAVSLGQGIWRRSVKVRVKFDIIYPLILGFPLGRDGLPNLWIPFKYEKLGNFCFKCGMLEHEHRDCSGFRDQLMRKEGMQFGIFGKWVRVNNSEVQLGLNIEELLRLNPIECSPSPTSWKC